jgi:hypothetical protein
MVKMVPILKKDLRPLIYKAFKDDWDLIHNYHLVNGSLEDCINSTMTEIGRVDAKEALQYYAVRWNNDPIGFTVVGDRFLLSFGLSIFYRTKEIIGQWWELVCSCLKDGFVTWIFKKNTRAINFLVKNGMEEIEDRGTYITLIRPEPIVSNQNREPCQQVD